MDHDNAQPMTPPQPFFYAPDNAFHLNYNPQLSPYQAMHSAHTQLQHGSHLPYHGLSMINTSFQNVYSASPPHAPPTNNATPPPPSPEIYDPLSPPVSGSDTSADGLYHHSNSSGANSPSSSRAPSLVHRNHPPIRYNHNPTPSPTSSSGRHHRRGFSQDSDEEEDGIGMRHVENLAHTRKEATRRQRIEAEQRRRDELRDGYAKLKDVLPVSNQKSSKVSLLERATNRIVALEKENRELQARLEALHEDVQRLQVLNEKISLSGSTPSPGRLNARPLSPPPDAHLPHRKSAHDSSAVTPPASSEGSC